MKRGRKPAGQNGSSQQSLVKSTYLLNRVLRQNLAVAALITGVDQSDLVRSAIADKLRKIGIRNPDQPLNLHELIKSGNGDAHP